MFSQAMGSLCLMVAFSDFHCDSCGQCISSFSTVALQTRISGQVYQLTKEVVS